MFNLRILLLINLFSISFFAISAPAASMTNQSKKDYDIYKKLKWNSKNKEASGSLIIHFTRLNETYIMEFNKVVESEAVTFFWQKDKDKIVLKQYNDLPLSFPELFSWIDTVNERHKAEKIDFSPIMAVGEISITRIDGKNSLSVRFYRGENYRFQIENDYTLGSSNIDEKEITLANGIQYTDSHSKINKEIFFDKMKMHSQENSKIIYKKIDK